MDFTTRIYTVKSISGDYAYLVIPEEPELEEKCVARALLPEGISEGCQVKYEMLQYSLI